MESAWQLGDVRVVRGAQQHNQRSAMVAHIHTLAFRGIDVMDVDIQVYIASGLPAFTIVGLPDKAVKESGERVRAALASLGLALPPKRITVNLAPADVLKEGSHFDLGIAVGLLAAMEVIPMDAASGYVVLGELALDGIITSVTGVLPAAIGATARDLGILCPAANGSEAAWSGNRRILAPDNLLALINHFKGLQILDSPKAAAVKAPVTYPDLQDIRGQETAKRALEIAAAGSHNMLMIGPPGAGKSMLAARLPGLLPPLSTKEMLECSMIASISGNLAEGGLTHTRPFRDPHHNCSMAAMVGGGRNAKPGEVTLAHHGVLFLDELPEFTGNVLEALRQPIETGSVTVSRVNAHATYPARFQLIAAMNPCRCGYLSDPEKACNKAPRCGSDYQSRISGPLFDRIDICIDVPAVNIFDAHAAHNTGETSAQVAERIRQARAIQELRYRDKPVNVNAQADGEVLLAIAPMEEPAKQLLLHAANQMGLSMRGYNRVLRVARTVADLEGEEMLNKQHIAEALSYRRVMVRSYA